MKKKILFINMTHEYGGGEVYLEKIINFSEKRFNYLEKIIISPENRLLTNLNKEVKIYKGVRKKGGIKNIFNYINYIIQIFKITKIIKKEKIDIVFFNGIEAAYLMPFLPKVKNRIAIWHINNINKNIILRKIFKKILLEVNSFIMITKEQEKSIENEFGLEYKRNLKLIYNGINENEFKFKEIKKNKKIIIAQISRLEKHKGIAELIKAFNNLLKKEKILELELLIAGEGNEKEKLNELIKELKLEDKIKLVGFVKTKEFLSKIDILVLNSYAEALPLILLEGLSSGVPIIATNVDGNKEIIINNHNGFLFEPGDSKKLEELLYKLTNDFELREKFSINGRNILLDKFRESEMCRKTYRLFEKFDSTNYK